MFCTGILLISCFGCVLKCGGFLIKQVADIKKVNGLVTDLQMFALPLLRIPLPGRHPPSPSLSNGSTSPRYEFNFNLSIINI